MSCCKEIASWVDLIEIYAEKIEGKFYKTVFHSRGPQLYERYLRQAQQSLVGDSKKR